MKMNKNGFTLVELLIVIALIAILSVAVLATINPIEQTNKARDSKFKNDAAEVLSAYERYYASQNAYPWTKVVTNPASVDASVVYASTDPHFGVLLDSGDTSGATGGILIDSSELKSSFMGKDYFDTNVTPEDTMYVYHNGNNGDNYVCYHPKANANRKVTNDTSVSLKCLNIAGAVLSDYGEAGCTIPSTGWDSTTMSGTNANLICVPEGMVQ